MSISSATFLPIRPLLHSRPSSTSSILKRRHEEDSPPNSPSRLEPGTLPKVTLNFSTASSFLPAHSFQRRRTPIQPPGSDQCMDLSLLGPPLFESSNPQFTNLGTPDSELLSCPSPISLDGGSGFGRGRRDGAFLTPIDTPVDSPMREDMGGYGGDEDMMDCEMLGPSYSQGQEGSAMPQYSGKPGNEVTSRDTDQPDQDMGMEETRVMSGPYHPLDKGKWTFVMGYRADCERCQNKEPGHFSHLVRKD